MKQHIAKNQYPVALAPERQMSPVCVLASRSRQIRPPHLPHAVSGTQDDLEPQAVATPPRATNLDAAAPATDRRSRPLSDLPPHT